MRKMHQSIWQDVIMAAFPATPVRRNCDNLAVILTVPAQREILRAACILATR